MLFISYSLSGRSLHKEISLDSMPSVFIIGDNQQEYEKLITQCATPLAQTCNNSMENTYKVWLGIHQAMENHAERIDFDIKGIKIWLNIFWDTDGSIKHLAYLPKPNCRNMDFDKLTQFFEKFVEMYESRKPSQDCYSHYGSAGFPSFADIYLDK